MKFTLPNSRGWFSLGLFLLTMLIVRELANHPNLADNHLFATLSEAIIITGLINLAASFYFGASHAADPPKAAPPAPQPAPPAHEPTL